MDTTCLCCLLIWSSLFLRWYFERHYTAGVLEHQRSGIVTPSCLATRSFSKEVWKISYTLELASHSKNAFHSRQPAVLESGTRFHEKPLYINH